MFESSDSVGSRPLILLIDDTPDDVRALVSLLGKQPLRLSVATDAHQGYQRALALRPALILLDVRMPQMDGFTLCRLLREADATRHTPVIFLSSAASIDERLEGLGLGAVDYVLKPFDPQEVLARIRIHLQLTWRAASAAPMQALQPQDADQLVLRAAMRFIAQNLGELPSLAEIARKVGTHDKRLSSIFREHLGSTVFAYVREVRLRKGQELLADSAISVQDIAELVGFRSACNFTTAFRERVGTTPSEYRLRVRDPQCAEPCVEPGTLP